MENMWPAGPDRTRHPWRVAGAGALAATGGIHLDLYLTGYRTIPTIGWLFLLQVISAFVLALAVLAPRGRLAAAAGTGFAVATLAGYLLSMWVGLFGFREVRTTAGIAAGILEVAAFAALAVVAVSPAGPGPVRSLVRLPAPPAALTRILNDGVPRAYTLVGGASVIALALLVTAVATEGGAPASGPGVLKTTTINGASVITNSRGLTLYWFAPDTARQSRCYGSCAQYWPPVLGTPAAGPGVTGTLGTIPRTGGGVQATYDGHPLYTYIADSGPGQDHGNNITINGGLWHQVTVGD